MTLSPQDTARTAAIEAMPDVPDLTGRRLAIRSDGDGLIGTGHAMRCLALAMAWMAAGGAGRLVCTALVPALAARYLAAGVEVATRDTWSAREVAGNADVLVADSPYLEDDELAALGEQAALTVTLDDDGSRRQYPPGILLNQNAHARAALYRGKTRALLCLGTAWCLLRPEFTAFRDDPAPIAAAVRRILVMMGGADPDGHSAPLLEAACTAAAGLDPPPEVVLLVGGANAKIEALRRQAAAAPVVVTVQHDVRDMARFLADADLAVSAGGSTIWELAVTGTPMILGAQNDTETGPAAAMAAAGAAIYLGPFNAITGDTVGAAVAALARDPERRRRMAEAARAKVDGRGIDRLLAVLGARLPPRHGI